jgi:hypothetical protein
MKVESETFYRIENLISEDVLSKVLKVSRLTLSKFRHEGCPWVKLGNRIFYHEEEFVMWLLSKKRIPGYPTKFQEGKWEET